MRTRATKILALMAAVLFSGLSFVHAAAADEGKAEAPVRDSSETSFTPGDRQDRGNILEALDPGKASTEESDQAPANPEKTDNANDR